MAEQVHCVFENYLWATSLDHALKSWGWEPVLIQRSKSLTTARSCPAKEQLLAKEEEWLEDYAFDILNYLKNIESPLLIIQAEITPGRRAAAHGVFLAELIWSRRVVPTVIATVDDRAGLLAEARRARRATKHPLVQIIRDGKGRSPEQPSMALWNILSGKDGLIHAVNLARALVVGKDAIPFAKELRDVLLSSYLASIRHRLIGLTASLRITEGAYKCGWIKSNDVITLLNNLKPPSTPEERELVKRSQRIIELSQEKTDPPKQLYNNLHVLVCDDDWNKSGWNILISRLLRGRFGIQTQGVTSIPNLKTKLENNKDTEVVTLLLDVHYVDDKTEEEYHLPATFIKELHECYPMLDVILFTSELKDGLLVREAYELGYRFFFKEIDEPARDPKTYAQKFVRVIEQSIKALPIRALAQTAKVRATELGAGREDSFIQALFGALDTWGQNPKPAFVYNLLPLLEEQFRASYIEIVKSPVPAKVQYGQVLKGIDIDKAIKNFTTKINGNEPIWSLWKEVFRLAQRCRNTLAHEADLILDAGSLLPSVGLAIPIVVAISLLYEARNTAGKDSGKMISELAEKLRSLCNSILISGHIKPKKEKVRELFDKAYKAQPTDYSAAQQLFSELRDTACNNIDLFGKDSSDRYFLVSTVVSFAKPQPQFLFSPAHWCTALCSLCIANHNSSVV